MLDEGTIKDIRFHSHQFSNDANGKMLLGMLFVFSKQYSDDLSAKVTRGNRGNFSEGKSGGAPKWGYTRNEVKGLYEPNDNFKIVQEAWQKRTAGESLEDIRKYLVENGCQRITKTKKDKPRIIVPTINTLSRMFRSHFITEYYFKQNKQLTSVRYTILNQ